MKTPKSAEAFSAFLGVFTLRPLRLNGLMVAFSQGQMQPLITQNQFIMWAVVIVYMVIITPPGSYYSKYMRTADAYFKGNNLIPW